MIPKIKVHLFLRHKEYLPAIFLFIFGLLILGNLLFGKSNKDIMGGRSQKEIKAMILYLGMMAKGLEA